MQPLKGISLTQISGQRTLDLDYATTPLTLGLTYPRIIASTIAVGQRFFRRHGRRVITLGIFRPDGESKVIPLSRIL